MRAGTKNPRTGMLHEVRVRNAGQLLNVGPSLVVAEMLRSRVSRLHQRVPDVYVWPLEYPWRSRR